MVRLISINIPLAVSACIDWAAKIEADKHIRPDQRKTWSAGYLHLAQEIEGLKFTSPSQVDLLVRAHSFLKPFVLR